MLCIEKEVRLTHRKRRANVSVVREHYLRDDISCKAEKCCICDHQIMKDTNGGFIFSSQCSVLTVHYWQVF